MGMMFKYYGFKKKVQKCVQCPMVSGSVWWVVGRKEEDIEELKWEKILRLSTKRRKNLISLLKAEPLYILSILL